jgi:hypothetical protein
MTYEQILQANKSIKTTDVKGKDYAEVNQRIKAFRSICPGGCIETIMLSCNDGVCVIQAIVKDETGKVLGTGHAYEKEGSTFINKTSYIENCETSAVGRALGMCGIGIDTSVASYEEVANAIKQQEEKVTPNHIAALMMLADRKGVTVAKLLKKYKIDKLEDMLMSDYTACVAGLNKMPDAEVTE